MTPRALLEHRHSVGEVTWETQSLCHHKSVLFRYIVKLLGTPCASRASLPDWPFIVIILSLSFPVFMTSQCWNIMDAALRSFSSLYTTK